MRWLIYSFILRYPTAAICILVLFVIIMGVVSVGWPAYVFLGMCVIMLMAKYYIDGKVETLSNKTLSDFELDTIEKKNRWIMGLLSVFALLGIIVSMHLTMRCIKYAANSTTIICTMALFHFSLIGIPYILMNMVKRKYSFWYGLMFPILLTAIIQFMCCNMLAESNDDIIIRFTSGDFERIKENWLITIPILLVPIIMLFDSLGKAFGFKVKDDTWDMGYDNNKHQLSIVINKKQSAIVMTISFVWCIISLVYCYYYMASLSGRSESIYMNYLL